MISILLHGLIFFLLSSFFSPKTNPLVKYPTLTKEPIHAVLIKRAPEPESPVKNPTIETQQPAPAKMNHNVNSDDQNKALQGQLMQQMMSEKQQYKQLTESQRIISEYQVKILKAIAAQWVTLPNNTDKALFCVYTIDLATNGNVIGVALVESSGDPTLDHAAEMAIYRASPLPVPPDPANFAFFRHFTLQLMPQQLQN
jgi:colicin import membrane protein